ncbi:hypothetical protein MEO93_19895, partial [Dolichospermum sp. ST_sed3]|nr:hypothetical protein [Dolichospermum sp. ST_sed3]
NFTFFTFDNFPITSCTSYNPGYPDSDNSLFIHLYANFLEKCLIFLSESGCPGFKDLEDVV